MTDTIRTITYLTTTEFRDGQVAGSISPQYVRDLIVTLQARTAVYNVNNAEFGAIGNGSSNPASSKYGTLAALQAVYGTTVGGVTIALTNELDWLAHQKAIDVATTAGGAVLSFSAYSYVMCNSNSVADGSGTLTFPAVSPFSPGSAVSWIGENFGGTNISWPNDLGSGKFAVLCGGRASSSSVGQFSNLVLTGPGVGSTLNASTCNMHGIGTNDRRTIDKVFCIGFYAGINVVGGQFIWSDVRCISCFYGVYFDNPQTVNFGNMQFIRCIWEACNKAGVGVNGSASIGASHFLSCSTSTSPYGFFKEIGNGSTPTIGFLNDCELIEHQFEAMGNAALSDANSGPTTRTCYIGTTKFEKCEFTWSGSVKISSLPQASQIDIGAAAMVDFDGFQNAGQFAPGTSGLFNILTVEGLRIKGEIAQLIANCAAATGGQLNQFINSCDARIRIIDMTGWEGAMCFNTDTVAVATSAVALTTGGNLGVAATAGSTSDTAFGVLMYNPTPGTAYSYCIYADRGVVPVKASGTTTGKWLRTASSGAVTPASGSNDTTTPMMGYGQGGVTGGTCNIKLRIA